LISITDRLPNYPRGDFETTSGASIEVKGQPINPAAYHQKNFVEVCEAPKPGGPKHRGGLNEVYRILGTRDILWEFASKLINGTKLADDIKIVPALYDRWPNRRTNNGPFPLSNIDYVSVSIHNFENAKLVVYVNADTKPKFRNSEYEQFIYVYRSDELLNKLREYVKYKKPLLLGAGDSSPVTFGARVDIPNWRWGLESGQWKYIGFGMASKAIADIKTEPGLS